MDTCTCSNDICGETFVKQPSPYMYTCTCTCTCIPVYLHVCADLCVCMERFVVVGVYTCTYMYMETFMREQCGCEYGALFIMLCMHTLM